MATEISNFAVVGPGSVTLPVVVHAPHGGTTIPDDVRRDLLLEPDALGTELLRMTDHRTDVFAEELVEQLGVVAFVNRLSRLVVDPERFLDAAAEEMEAVGMGAVYRSTHDGRPLRDLDPSVRQTLLERYFHPYTEALAACVEGVLDEHGTCLLVDLHSYPSEKLPYELHGQGARPAVCIGTDDFHTPAEVTAAIAAAARRHELSTAENTPFAGTYVPLAHFGRDERVSSVMIELRRDVYIDEETAEPTQVAATVTRFLADAVREAASYIASR